MTPRELIDWRLPRRRAWAGSEHLLQVAVISMAMSLAAKHPGVLLLHAIPNGGQRGKKTGAALKAEGVLPGVPDLCLPVARGPFHGFYLELKKAGGSVDPVQWQFMEALHEEGYCVRLTNHQATAFELLRDYLELPSTPPSGPAWVPCPDCDDKWCNIHGKHAHECPCPPIEEWTTDPYTTTK